MPYIKPERRPFFVCDQGYVASPKNAGELNYCITKLLVEYLTSSNSKNYQTINDILGALEGAKLEFYRRIAVPYENQKMYENGDVYDPK